MRKDALENVGFALHVEGKLTSASFRCVDNNVQIARFRIKRRQSSEQIHLCRTNSLFPVKLRGTFATFH